MRVLIVDDEPPSARGIERYCKEVIGNDLESLKMFDSLFPAIYYLEENPIDLLFLDVELNGENGFDLLKNIEKQSFYTIVTSSHTEYAVQAFEHSVLDFLPKPFTKTRFEAAIQKMKNVWGVRSKTIRFIPVKKDISVEMISFEDILYFESDKNYTIIHLKSGEKERVRRTLDKYMEILPPQFIRAHKSCIVNKFEVLRILHGKNNTFQLQLKNKVQLPLSRSMYVEFSS
ncbi:MAG: response regulator transcription factor [Leptospiraceae bacterium]|nr:response regulator transcription factor [Leptospiraceae bacterium]MCP5494292.1 response regulator transcription factor [Leptospiraceae bacterium]